MAIIILINQFPFGSLINNQHIHCTLHQASGCILWKLRQYFRSWLCSLKYLILWERWNPEDMGFKYCWSRLPVLLSISSRTGYIIFRVQYKMKLLALVQKSLRILRQQLIKSSKGPLLLGSHVHKASTGIRSISALCINVGSASMSNTLTTLQVPHFLGQLPTSVVPTGCTCSFCLLVSPCPNFSN